jgi:hypothetical protein
MTSGATTRSVTELTEGELTRVLTYVGLVLLSFELVKSLIIRPIKAFYSHVTFGPGMPFKSYEEDVLSRHRNEFEACLLYLRDFMQAINSDDLDAIQALRTHRNEVAHSLVDRLHVLSAGNYASLLERADRALFKLSSYRAYMDVGADPKIRNLGIDWSTVKGHEYLLFEEVRRKIGLLEGPAPRPSG